MRPPRRRLGRPAAHGTKLICNACVEAVDQIAGDAGYLDPDDVTAAEQLDEMSALESHDQAMTDEQEWRTRPDDTLVRGPYSAWTADRRA